MFDLFGNFKVNLIAETDKSLTMRYPSDGEWCGRVRAMKTIRRSLGRKRAEITSVSTGAFDLELFEKIRIGGPDIDEFEATSTLDRLDRTEVISVERESRFYVVKFKAFGGAQVSHSIRIPSEKASRRYFDQSGKTVFESRNSEIRSFLEPSGTFYEEHFGEATGYSVPEGKTLFECIPINHKSVAVSETLMAISDSITQDEQDPN